MITKSITAGVIFAASDIMAQWLEHYRIASGRRIAWHQVTASSLVGLCFFGPAAHLWYGAMQRSFPGGQASSVAAKLCLGQAIFGPTFTIVFFAASLLADGGAPALGFLPAKIAKDLLPTLASGLLFWSMVDLISYSVIAQRPGGEDWIPLFANACSFLWQVFLSAMARRAARQR